MTQKQGKTGREGKCYRLAYEHIFEAEEGILIHADVWSSTLNKMIDHALVETDTGWIWEPVSDQYLPKQWLYDKLKVVEHARYTEKEALLAVCKYGTYGPWEEEEAKQRKS